MNYQIEMMNIEDLKPHPGNPRIHPASTISKLQASLKTYGWTSPVLLSAEGYIIAGHGRVKAAKANGMTTVPVLRLSLSGKEAEAYMLADNRLPEESLWDQEKLRDMIRGLGDIDLSITGFDEDELDALMEESESLEPDIFRPELNPSFDRTVVTPEIFERAQQREAERFDEDREYRSVECPHCGGRFDVEIKD